MPKFSTKSQERLSTCHPDLIHLFEEVIKEVDCSVLEGHRTMERQKQLFRDGKSKTLASNHLYNPSKAADVMQYPIDWEDKLEQHKFATIVYKKAIELGIKVRWGGNFKSFYDAPHWELIGE